MSVASTGAPVTILRAPSILDGYHWASRGKNNPPAAPPPMGQASWEGLTSAQADKAFEAAVTTNENSPPLANPFGNVGTSQKVQTNAH